MPLPGGGALSSIPGDGNLLALTLDDGVNQLGYSMPTMGSGSLEDQNGIGEDQIVTMAHKCFNPQAIVIGHLNHLPVTHVYGQLVDVIRFRDLRTVTLDDVFARPEQQA